MILGDLIMPRLKLTATLEYDADPENYDGAESPEEMAEMDMDMAIDIINNSYSDGTLIIKIQPV